MYMKLWHIEINLHQYSYSIEILPLPTTYLQKLIELDSSIFIKIHFPDHVTDLVPGHILSQSLHE